jgi:hypothetical protein
MGGSGVSGTSRWRRMRRSPGSRFQRSMVALMVGMKDSQDCLRCKWGHRGKWCQSSSVQPHADGQLADGLC